MIMVWPKSLPKPERNSYQSQSQDARRKRSFENGPAGSRRRFSAVSRLVTFSFILDRSQRATFDYFYHIECSEGASMFYMPDPTVDGWAFLASDGAQLTDAAGVRLLVAKTMLCTWGDTPPVETVQGIEFRKQIQIVVMP